MSVASLKLSATRGTLLWAAAAIGLLSQAAGAEVIRLKSSAVVEPHQDVHLGDIATITPKAGEKSAQSLADMVILSDVSKPAKIKAETVLMALIAQGGPASSGGLQIGGAAECDITLVSKTNVPIALATPAAQLPVTLPVAKTTAVAAPKVPTPTTAPAATDATLNEMIKARILQDVPASELILSVDTISPLLDSPVPAGRKWLCRPLAKAMIGAVPFEAKLVEGTRIIEQLNVQTTIKRLQAVPVNIKRITRGDVITADAIRIEQIPLDRKMTTLFPSEKELIGLEAQRDMEVGTMMDQRDFRPAYMTHKNESVTVYYIAGALTVQMRGRAMADAKLHEKLQVRNESTHELYDVTVIAKDLGVAGGTLTAEQESKLREGNP